jgi:hypothetical protein
VRLDPPRRHSSAPRCGHSGLEKLERTRHPADQSRRPARRGRAGQDASGQRSKSGAARGRRCRGAGFTARQFSACRRDPCYSCYSCYSPRPHRIHPIVTALYTRRVHLVAAWEAELGARPSTPPSMPRCHSSDELRKRQGGCSPVPPRGPTMGCDNAGPRYDQRAKLHSPTDEG